MALHTLIPVDDSATTQRMIDTLLANPYFLREKTFGLLHVVDVQSMQRLVPDIQKGMIYQAAEKAGQRLLEKLSVRFQKAGYIPQLRLEMGAPEKLILKLVEELDIQLLILGRHEGGGLRDIVFGSVSNVVVHHARCPVLLL